MPVGTVKFFNETKGFGFIQPDDGGQDAFVHITAVEQAGMRTLNKDQKVSYDLEQDQRGKTKAVNLQSAYALKFRAPRATAPFHSRPHGKAFMKDYDLYIQRAEEARSDADDAVLANVRDRCLRAEAAWKAMADRAARTENMRASLEAHKAAALAAAAADAEAQAEIQIEPEPAGAK